jgi:poly-gamma-glutamate capsule biosynthesis protein CapA/YwtB (metallophosphatase superfamily)
MGLKTPCGIYVFFTLPHGDTLQTPFDPPFPPPASPLEMDTVSKEASEPVMWEAQGRKVGLIACTDNEPEWAASGNHPGVWHMPIRVQDARAHQLFEMVQRTKANVACLIISVHWGPNWGYDPPAGHQPFARALIDHGADIVFGHSGRRAWH